MENVTKKKFGFCISLVSSYRLLGPQPGRQAKPVVLVEDNGPIHTSKRSLAALAARAHWLTIEWLPKYAPELNEIEPVWRDLSRWAMKSLLRLVGLVWTMSWRVT